MVVAAVANRHCCQHQATKAARRIPPAMLARARSRMAEATATPAMMAVMLDHAGIGGIAVQEVLGEETRLQRPKKGRR